MTYTHIYADSLSSYLAPRERPPSGGRSQPHFSLREGSAGDSGRCHQLQNYVYVHSASRCHIANWRQSSEGARATAGQIAYTPARPHCEERIGGTSRQRRGLRIVLTQIARQDQSKTPCMND